VFGATTPYNGIDDTIIGLKENAWKRRLKIVASSPT
jgi:hypothetical protein